MKDGVKDRKKIAKIMIYNVVEILLIALGILTFRGEKYIGYNLPRPIFAICLGLFLIAPLYKSILKFFDKFEEIKKGIS